MLWEHGRSSTTRMALAHEIREELGVVLSGRWTGQQLSIFLVLTLLVCGFGHVGGVG